MTDIGEECFCYLSKHKRIIFYLSMGLVCHWDFGRSSEEEEEEERVGREKGEKKEEGMQGNGGVAGKREGVEKEEGGREREHMSMGRPGIFDVPTTWEGGKICPIFLLPYPLPLPPSHSLRSSRVRVCPCWLYIQFPFSLSQDKA